ncbi:MAG: type II toxin-antitoxin system RelE/ParE family toxin [bacterium]
MDKVVKIIWTEDGINSFVDVIEYISNDSLYYASNFAKKVLSLVDNLMSFSQIGRIVPEYNNPKIREILYQNYRIVYRIKKNAIYIVLIIHGTKELPQIIS